MTACFRGVKYVVEPKKAKAPTSAELMYRGQTYRHR